MQKVSKEREKKIMDLVRKAGDSENYEVSHDDRGIPVVKNKVEIKKGKKARASGAQFELKVRKDLESQGRVNDKWNNNVGMWDKEGNEVIRKKIEKKDYYVVKKTDKKINFEEISFAKLIQAKRKYNPFKKMLIVGTGFPDFVSIKQVRDDLYSVIGVECKINGLLSKEEKEKCAWLLKNGIFSAIWIARKGGKRGQIIYDDFGEKYGEKFLC